MRIFVTGATGFIGSRLALRLAGEGSIVHALYRDEAKTAVIRHPNIQLFRGNILDYQSLLPAVKGCACIYHAAAFARVWDKDVSTIYRQNIEGTHNVIRAGLESGVNRIVCTSTAGVLGPSGNGLSVNEESPKPGSFFTEYESSKSVMEESLGSLVAHGADIVIVNPTRVYGPGILSDSNGVTRIMERFIRGKWRIIPGNGSSIGNYVYVEDVVSGYILAMEKGKSGERYVLGGSNLTYTEFFNVLKELTGRNYRMIHMPVPVMQTVSEILLLLARISGGAPLISPGLVRKYNHNWSVSSDKARNELGYDPVDFRTGADLTMKWLTKPR